MKIIGVFIGVCAPYSSLESYQQKVSEVGKNKKSKIELRKDKVCQNNY